MNKKCIYNIKTNFNKDEVGIKNYLLEKDSYLNNQLKKINKKPKIRKEMNIPNSKIKRLIIEKSENNSENIDEMDDVCNFSGINNISYTNNQEVEHKNDLFDDNFDEDFQRAHSPKPIFHKKINFRNEYPEINKAKEKKFINSLFNFNIQFIL